MRAGIALKTNIPDLQIDYLELEDTSGNVFNVERDSTNYCNEDGIYSAEWRGVMINGNTDYRLRNLPRCAMINVGLYWDSDVTAPTVRDMAFVLVDDEETRRYMIKDACMRGKEE